MSRRIPLLPTLLVAVAMATMVALGVWQLQRARSKQALLRHYESAAVTTAPASWPRSIDMVEGSLYRPSHIYCERVLASRATAGRSASGEPGWAHVSRCVLDGGGEADVVLGWSRSPQQIAWAGGKAAGVIAPAGDGARLVADPPLAGLAPNARPDPRDLPNNHLAYAGQWFFFAATAGIIYALALRRKWRPQA